MGHVTLLVGLLAFAVACGGGSAGGESGNGGDEAARSKVVPKAAPRAPRVAADYQDAIDRAWNRAAEGTHPSKACAALQGRLLRFFRGEDAKARDDARGAAEACSVLVGSRYFLTVLEAVESGTRTCNDFLTESATTIGALVLSLEAAGEVVAAARRKRLVELIKPRVEEVCPGMGRVL